jgi:glyoxylase-like metal-dependent hydrolase (beta-lactamase superfamily II)
MSPRDSKYRPERTLHKVTYLTRAVAAALAITTAGLATAQTVQSELHRNAATLNVMGDAFMMQYARAFYCNLPDDNNQIVIASRGWNNQTGTGSNAQYRIPATQIFDDVWFVGNHYVGQYLIKTPTGFVQVDAGNRAEEVALFNVPAMQSLGLSATYPLTGIFLTHGHGDHDGGAKYLLDTLGARSWLGSADAAGKSYVPNLIDSTDLSFRQVAVGGKTFWVLPTPGHTNGSTSAVLEVQDWGTTRRVLINGGQSMTNSIPAVQNYLTSIERTYAMAKALHVEGVMTPHIYWDGEGAKMNEILATGRTNPGQHIYGHEKVMQQLVVARECSAAWLTRLDATASRSVWRYNVIEFVGNLAPENVQAKLHNGWGPLAGQPVTLSVAETGVSCTAVTDAEGIASCKVRPLRPHQDTLKATFAGAETAEFVDLPAETSALVCSNEGVCKN